MSKAKYYIYRNLTKDCFSIRHKGRVVCHAKSLIAHNATFKVSELGRQRVLRENKKYVHAFVVCESYAITGGLLSTVVERKNCQYKEVRYNPFTQAAFTLDSEPVYKAATAYLAINKVFV